MITTLNTIYSILPHITYHHIKIYFELPFSDIATISLKFAILDKFYNLSPFLYVVLGILAGQKGF
jgi:hypothetical protein